MFPVLRENLVRLLGGKSSDRMACNMEHRLLSTGDRINASIMAGTL